MVVLGHAFWQREYGGADDIVGRTIPLAGQPFRIIGVAAPGFTGAHVGRTANIFAPLCAIETLRPGTDLLEARSTWFLYIMGRRAKGRSIEETGAILGATAPAVYSPAVPTHWAADEQAEFMEYGLRVVPASTGLSVVRGQYRTALLTLLVVVAVVLLIACANVAQLLLARATARQHEVAVRLAMGSGRWRLVRQLLTESTLLAFLGAVVGVLFARWSAGLIVRFLSDGGRPVALDLSLDPLVLFFTIAVASMTGILFGLAPAWRSSRVSPQRAIRGAGRGLVGASNAAFARGIVIAQMALSLVLVMGAGLLVGTFQRLSRIDPGFDPEGVLLVETGWSDLQISEGRQATFPRELVDRVRALPGVVEASASLTTPISGSAWNEYVEFEGAEDSEGEPLVWFNGVTDGYVKTLALPLLAGRDLDARDVQGAPRVALVNETLARRFFGDANPIGRRLRTVQHEEVGPSVEIVGLVGDSKYRRLDEATLPTAFVPLEQTALWGSSIRLSVRAAGAPEALVPAVTDAMRRLDPAITLEFETMTGEIARSLARPRLLATLSGFFGVLALLLAVIGLYGTMAYRVARRRNEMGVRIALGAPRPRILGLVAGEAGRIIGIGVVAGMVLALAATRWIGSFLYGVSPTDPITLIASAAGLAAVGMLAALGPAWRAARLDPMVTLREE